MRGARPPESGGRTVLIRRYLAVHPKPPHSAKLYSADNALQPSQSLNRRIGVESSMPGRQNIRSEVTRWIDFQFQNAKRFCGRREFPLEKLTAAFHDL